MSKRSYTRARLVILRLQPPQGRQLLNFTSVSVVPLTTKHIPTGRVHFLFYPARSHKPKAQSLMVTE